MSEQLLSLEDVQSIHQHSSHHKADLEQSTLCGCFYCLESFLPSEIEDWCGDGQTALCPKCGIDSVLGNKRLPRATEKSFLQQMHRFWFLNDATQLRRIHA